MATVVRYYIEIDFSERNPGVTNVQQGIVDSVLRLVTGDTDSVINTNTFYGGLLIEDGINSLSTSVDIDQVGEFSLSNGGSVKLHNANYFFDFCQENNIYLFNAIVEGWRGDGTSNTYLGKYSVKALNSSEDIVSMSMQTVYSRLTGTIPNQAMPNQQQDASATSPSVPVTVGNVDAAELVRVTAVPTVVPNIYAGSDGFESNRTRVWTLYGVTTGGSDLTLGNAMNDIIEWREEMDEIDLDIYNVGDQIGYNQHFFNCVLVQSGWLRNTPFIGEKTYLRVVSGSGNGEVFEVDRLEALGPQTNLMRVWLRESLCVWAKAIVGGTDDDKTVEYTYSSVLKYGWNAEPLKEFSTNQPIYGENPAPDDVNKAFCNSFYLATQVPKQTGFESDVSVVDLVSYDLSMIVSENEIESYNGAAFYIDDEGSKVQVNFSDDAFLVTGAWGEQYAGLELPNTKVGIDGKVFSDISYPNLPALLGLRNRFQSGANLVSFPMFLEGAALQWGEGAVAAPNRLNISENAFTQLYTEYGETNAPGVVRMIDDSTPELSPEGYLIVDQSMSYNMRVDGLDFGDASKVYPIFMMDATTRPFDLGFSDSDGRPTISWIDLPEFWRNDGNANFLVRLQTLTIRVSGVDYAGNLIEFGDHVISRESPTTEGDTWGTVTNPATLPETVVKIGAVPNGYWDDVAEEDTNDAFYKTRNMYYDGDFIQDMNIADMLKSTDVPIKGVIVKLAAVVYCYDFDSIYKAAALKFRLRALGLHATTEVTNKQLYVPVTGQKWPTGSSFSGAPTTIPEMIAYLLVQYSSVVEADLEISTFNSLKYGRLSEIRIGKTFIEQNDIRPIIRELCKLGMVATYVNPKTGKIELTSWMDDYPLEGEATEFSPKIFGMDSFGGIIKPSRSSITTRMDFSYCKVGDDFTKRITVNSTAADSFPSPIDERVAIYVNPNGELSDTPEVYADTSPRLGQFTKGGSGWMYQWVLMVPYSQNGYWRGLAVGQKISFTHNATTQEHTITALYQTSYTPPGWTTAATIVGIDKPTSIPSVTGKTLINHGFNQFVNAGSNNLPDTIMDLTNAVSNLTLQTSQLLIEDYFTGIDFGNDVGICQEIWENCRKGYARSETLRAQQISSSDWVWDRQSALLLMQRWSQWETYQHDTTTIIIPQREWVKSTFKFMGPIWFIDPVTTPNGRPGWIDTSRMVAKNDSIEIGIIFGLDPRESNPVQFVIDEGAGDVDGSAFPTIDEDYTTDILDEEF